MNDDEILAMSLAYASINTPVLSNIVTINDHKLLNDATLINLYKKLDDTPEDWDLRLIIADRWEELGVVLYADACRWMSEKKKRARYYQAREKFIWYPSTPESHVDPQSDLPDTIFYAMLKCKPKRSWGSALIRYSSRVSSEISLLKGWELIRGQL